MDMGKLKENLEKYINSSDHFSKNSETAQKAIKEIVTHLSFLQNIIQKTGRVITKEIDMVYAIIGSIIQKNMELKQKEDKRKSLHKELKSILYRIFFTESLRTYTSKTEDSVKVYINELNKARKDIQQDLLDYISKLIEIDPKTSSSKTKKTSDKQTEGSLSIQLRNFISEDNRATIFGGSQNRLLSRKNNSRPDNSDNVIDYATKNSSILDIALEKSLIDALLDKKNKTSPNSDVSFEEFINRLLFERYIFQIDRSSSSVVDDPKRKPAGSYDNVVPKRSNSLKDIYFLNDNKALLLFVGVLEKIEENLKTLKKEDFILHDANSTEFLTTIRMSMSVLSGVIINQYQILLLHRSLKNSFSMFVYSNILAYEDNWPVLGGNTAIKRVLKDTSIIDLLERFGKKDDNAKESKEKSAENVLKEAKEKLTELLTAVNTENLSVFKMSDFDCTLVEYSESYTNYTDAKLNIFIKKEKEKQMKQEQVLI